MSGLNAKPYSPSSTFLVTTDPAPTTAPFPMCVTFGRIIEPAPNQ